MSKVVVTGGGTGGHLFAALTFAEYLKSKNFEPIFIGSEYGLESEILQKYPFRYHLLKTKGFVGKDIKDKIKSSFLIAKSTAEAIKLINSIKPIFSIGFGGYVSFPVILASKMLGVKTAILEQNSIPGKANKILSKICDITFVNFELTRHYLKNAIVVGNPTRIKPKNKPRNFKNPLTIGVMGGSRGARSINNAMKELSRERLNIKVIHQTGRDDYDDVLKTYKRNGKNWKAYPFIDDMENFYDSIDFIVCRAGATTLSEIACARLGSILIPYPYAVYNHQYYNAKYFADNGAAFVIEDENLTGKKLLSVISSLTVDKLKMMSDNAKRLCRKDTCENMLELMLRAER